MTQAKHESIRRKLDALLRRMRPEVSAMTEQTLSPSGGQGANELSNVPLHLGDGGTDEFLHDLNATLLENEEYLANEVRAALVRMEKGAFGQCERCGKSIAAERLDAVPYVRFCIRCASIASDAPDVSVDKGRPRTPADTLASEGERSRRDAGERSFAASAVDRETGEALSRDQSDAHAAGTPGGGGPGGGLGGTNAGHGDPEIGELEESMGSGDYDMLDARDAEPNEPRAGHAGGAVGGFPANKRARVK